MTVIMKVDLVGPQRRGLALGLNEFAGYLSVALSAWATGEIASRYSLRPEPFYYGGIVAIVGLTLSAFFVRETRDHVALEIAQGSAGPPRATAGLSFRDVFAVTTWRDRNLAAACQAGLVNTLNDGMSWGIYPLFFAQYGLGVAAIGVVKAVYPGVWGALQVVTGPLSDRIGRKGLIAGGMLVQAGGIWLTVLVPAYPAWIAGAVLQGLGTAMVYPTLLAVVGDVAHPSWRATSYGVYRLWRDLGYAVGALLAGLIADWLGMAAAIHVVALLTLLSGLVVLVRMRETLGGLR
jgi:MFS family permease